MSLPLSTPPPPALLLPPRFILFAAHMAPVASIVLMLAPLPTLFTIPGVSSPDVSQPSLTIASLPLLPYTCMLLNSSLWTFYGLLLADPPIITCNAIGVILSSLFLTIFVQKSGGLKQPEKHSLPLSSASPTHAPPPTFLARRDLPSTPAAHFKLSTFVLSLGFLLFLTSSRHLLGLLANVVCLALFVSPLSKLAQIVRAGYAPPGSIPVPFALAQALNCFMWSVHGVCTLDDAAVWVPNVLGLAAAVAQAGVSFYFGGSARACKVESM